VVLYDQYDNGTTTATLSATFTDFPTSSADLADDFVVPGGQTWNVQSIDADGLYFNGPGPANSWNVFIYTDSCGLPGTQIYSILNTTVTVSGTTFTVDLTPAAVLTAGTYWIEIQANMTFVPNGEWGWTDRSVQSNQGAAFRNPGGAFGCGTDWVRKPVCVPTTGGPDQVYRINGTSGGGGTPTATPTGTPAGCTPGPWNSVANMPTDLYGAAGASDGTFFYAAGGYSFSSGNTLNVLNKYDPGSNTWTPLASMPQSQIEGCGVYDPANNKFYVFGGEDAATGTNYNLTQIYDIASNTWSMGATMPDVHSFAACGYIPASGKIYVLSGYNSGQVTSAQPNTWEYDPVADSWTDLTGTVQFPHPTGGAAFGVINNKLYVAGGRDATNTVINLTWEFDPTGPVYNAKTDEPGTFQNNVPGSGAAQNVLWVFGGGNPFSAANGSKTTFSRMGAPTRQDSSGWSRFQKFLGVKQPATDTSGRFYDPATDTWTSSPNMTALRSFPASGAIGSNLIIAAGGFNGSTTVASAETENVCAQQGTPSPTPTGTPGCIVVNGGFETGSLPPWTDTGDTSFTGVGPPAIPHSGSFALFSGPSTSDGFIDQTLPTVAGQAYDVSFWLQNTGTDQNNRFGASFGSVTLVAEAAQGPFGYTLFTFNGVVPGANADLHFIFYNPPSYFYLDDVCVTPSGGGGSPTPTPSPSCTPGGSWSEVAAYPFASRGPFVVSDGTFYYTGGGYDGSNVHSDVFKYDPVANTFTPLASAPDQFFLSQAVIFNNKIYSIAGFNLGGQSTTTRIYDIAGNSWTTGTAIPEASGLSDAATGLDSTNGNVLVACGFNGSGASNTLHIYNIAGNSWTLGATAPTAVYLPGAGTINGKFYVASGNNGSTEVPDLQIYDIASGTWSEGPAVPTPVTAPGSAVIGGKLYLFGGAAPFPTTTTITQIYDPGTNSWSSGPNMVAPKLWFYGGALDDTSVFAPGGDNPPGIPITDAQLLAGGGCGSPTPTATPTATGSPICSPQPWVNAANMPTDLYGAAAASDGTFFYAAGGYSFSSGNTLAGLNKYDPGSNTWTPLASMPQSQIEGCGVYDPANNKFYVFGGEDAVSGTNYNLTQIYDIASNTWSMGATMPDVRSFAACGYIPASGKMYLLSGYNSGQVTSAQPNTWEYDPVANS
jgi:N-acetylneuraminic acid mutarotase